AESDETDNVVTAALTADVPELTVGGEIDANLSGGRALIARIAPQGEATRLSVDGPAGGELAVRAGLVPTKTAADLLHTGPGGVVLAPSDAVRYVRVVLPAGVSGKVTVALASMPFGIAAASPTRVSNG